MTPEMTLPISQPSTIVSTDQDKGAMLILPKIMRKIHVPFS